MADENERDRPPRDGDRSRPSNRGGGSHRDSRPGGAGSRGGTGRSGAGGGRGGSSSGGRPPQRGSYGGRPSGPRRDYDGTRDGDRASDGYRSRDRDDRPRDRDDRPRDRDDRPRERDYDRPRREYDRPRDRDQRSRNDSDRPGYDARPRRDFSDGPRRDFNDRPRRDYRDTPRRDYSDRPRDYGDRPRRDFTDQPRRSAAGGARNFDRPRRDYDARPRPDGDRPRDYDRPRPDVERPRRDWQPRGGRPVGRPYTARPFSERGPQPHRPPQVDTAVSSGEFLAEDEELVAGRRPVEEAFAARREAIRLLVVPERRAALDQLVIHATTLRIPVVELEGGSLTSLAGFDGHQGIALVARARPAADMEQILAAARARNQAPFVLVLDSLEDPQNFGTMLRSAEAVGVHGVFYPTRRSAPLSPSAIKASAGATEHLLLAPEGDLAATLTDLHGRGLRIVAAEEDAALDYSDADLRGPLALVVGSEGQGISSAIRRRIDLSVRIPMRGRIASLNAAVAGSILLFAAAQQRPASVAPQPFSPGSATGPLADAGAADAEPAKPQGTRKPKVESEAAHVAEVDAPAKPKRTRKPKAEAEAARVAEVDAASKPKRTRKPKAEAAAAQVAEVDARPKPKRTRKPKPDAAPSDADLLPGDEPAG